MQNLVKTDTASHVNYCILLRLEYYLYVILYIQKMEIIVISSNQIRKTEIKEIKQQFKFGKNTHFNC